MPIKDKEFCEFKFFESRLTLPHTHNVYFKYSPFIKMTFMRILIENKRFKALTTSRPQNYKSIFA